VETTSALPSTRYSLLSPDAPAYAYLLAHEPPEHQMLSELRRLTNSRPDGFMQIGPDQAHLLAFLVKLTGARRILELGTFIGYSALTMALAAPADGRVITCDWNAEGPRVGETFWERAGVASVIEARIGSAIDVLKELEHAEGAESFDLIFIDADKPNYDRHYEAALRLVRAGGLIILDNMLHLGRVSDSDHSDPGTVAIRGLNQKIAHDERVDRVILPIGDGVTLVRRR
jgi:O-methyltransferase